MKYWWLEKYKNFKIVEINDLIKDVNYFLIMPKNYEKIYQEIKNEDISNLEEEELLILLKKITTTKNLKNNQLRLIIEKLLLIPDNSFPNSDYTLLEELTEIKNLKQNPPLKEKINSNNLAICYHCLNIFFVDKIKNVNKKNNCLCPYCLKQTLYFDNDYIPMNYTFIKLFTFIYQHFCLAKLTFRHTLYNVYIFLRANLPCQIFHYKLSTILTIFPAHLPIPAKLKNCICKCLLVTGFRKHTTFVLTKNSLNLILIKVRQYRSRC